MSTKKQSKSGQQTTSDSKCPWEHVTKSDYLMEHKYDNTRSISREQCTSELLTQRMHIIEDNATPL
jgi:hypothetical protein